jgi:transposase
VETFPLTEKGLLMARRPSFPPEFRRRVLEKARAGSSVSEVAREFDIARQTIMNWLKQDDLDAGRRDDGLTSDERKELTLLRRENKRLRLEAEILSKAAAWFARETNAVPNKSSES